jgi:xanthine dehydrogenase YagR molybdenum-binding subunit
MADTAPKKKKIKVPRVVNGIETMVEIEVDDTGGPTWGPNDKHAILNHRLTRVDGPAKVSGAAIYSYDIRLPGMLYGRILRSPYAHARVKKVDLAAAKRIPGVRAVTSVEQVKAQELKERERRPQATAAGATSGSRGGGSAAQREALERTGQEVRYEGEPIAAAAAITPELADDAIHAIQVEYEVLPHVVTADAAIKPGAPIVLGESNLEEKEKKGELDKVQAAFKQCDAIIEAEYRTQTIHHACLETHGIVVDYRGRDSATIYASTQGTFSIPRDGALALSLDESHVTSVVEHMGGGFGSKWGIEMGGKLACQLSREAKAPVKMMLARHDEFVTAGNRSGSWQKLKGGVKKDGTLVAFQATQYRLGGIGQGSQSGQPYVYSAANAYREVYSLHTNVDSSRAMRAPGHPQASFAMESLMDELAYKLGMDPLEFRKKNLKDPFYHRQLDRGAKEIGWERRQKVPGEGSGPLKRGLGCGVGSWGGGGRPQCVVTVAIARDGAVNVSCGTQDLGTGTRTYMRAIVAEEFGLTIGDIREHIGNSKLGAANGSGGSTTAASLSPAVKDAAVNARVEMAAKLAPVLNAKREEISFAGGEVKAGEKTLRWKQACAGLPAAGISARGEWKPGLSESGVHGAAFAEVEVDVETGHVRPIKIVHVQDVGLPLNRLAIESQLNGGIIQALGMALWEGRVMDERLGVMVNPNFEDYKLPGVFEIPEIVALIDDADTREAVIGVGEPPVIPTVGAVANAVFNACGIRVRELPITPDKILMALQPQGRTT